VAQCRAGVNVDRRAAIAAVLARRLPAPATLRTTKVAAGRVTLHWAAPKHAKPHRYVVLRDGRAIGRTAHRTFTDRHAKAGHTYRYTVAAIYAHGRRGRASRALLVRVPRLLASPPGTVAPPASANTVPPIAPVAPAPPAPPAPPPPVAMTAAMVDRLFWRAGFGPLQKHRDAWTGRAPEALVDWMLGTPSNLQATSTPPLSDAAGFQNQPIDPAANDDELLMEWLDIMQRADNPLPERLAFFWHRHWAVSREDGSVQVPWILTYRERMRRYADFAADPGLSFRDLAWEMTTQDPAMSMYLNGNQNVKRSPNENYAREFQELFCLGPTGPDGSPSYTQDDVHSLARAFTGWRLDTTAGQVSFQSSNFDTTAKALYPGTAWAVTVPATTGQSTDAQVASVRTAVNAVLAHPNHAQFLIRKLWAEFIASPIPPDTLAGLVAQYTAGGALALRPVLRGILTHPLIFESIGEPNLVKPPVVYLVGLLRLLGAPMKGSQLRVASTNMQQVPYKPPNVAGWEGGMSWLNTNTVQGRFDAAVRVLYLKYSPYYPNQKPLDDLNVLAAADVVEAAHASVSRPWMSQGTRDQLRTWAAGAPATTLADLRKRFHTLQALILGGPDGQVM
jgi:uncharacterized protein (DUF1800 family)